MGINSNDRKGLTPLSYAAQKYITRWSNCYWDGKTFEVNLKDRDGRTPLALAAENIQSEVARLLLEQNEVDVNSKDNYGGTPLLLAARYELGARYEELAEMSSHCF